MRRWRETARGERAAALVEFAIAFPLIVMLIMGMISAGIAYNHQLALSHAAREGGRFGATLPVSTMNAWLDSVAAATVDDAIGTLGAGAAGHYVCVAYVHPDGTLATDQTSRRLDNGGAVSYDSLPCFTDTRPSTERRVQVRVARDSDFSVVFFSSTINLDSDSVNRFEAALGG